MRVQKNSAATNYRARGSIHEINRSRLPGKLTQTEKDRSWPNSAKLTRVTQRRMRLLTAPKRTPCAYIEDLTVEPFVIDDEGYLQIPEKPGLGIELDREKLEKYRGE